jgi:DNA invertase Pin-like site-specific DNA recombinase
MAISHVGVAALGQRAPAGVKAARGQGAKFGRKPKLSPRQIAHARKLIDEGQRREDVAALLNVDHPTRYRVLSNSRSP